jgi:hypothetical protein
MCSLIKVQSIIQGKSLKIIQLSTLACLVRRRESSQVVKVPYKMNHMQRHGKLVNIIL